MCFSDIFLFLDFHSSLQQSFIPQCSKYFEPSRWAGSQHVLFDFERSISKSDLRSGQVRSRSGQVKVRSGEIRSRSGHDPSRSICISSEVSWRDKSFGAICASLSPFCRELLAKKRLEDEINFEPGGPAPNFLKNKLSSCGKSPTKNTPAFWLHEKSLSMTHPIVYDCTSP